MAATPLSFSGCTEIRLSTKNRSPWCVGTLPAEGCGLATKPRASRSAITLRTVAELTATSLADASCLDGTGAPSAR